ncbi:unnamed protein product [Heligmosomoides polygyrus]|uniref:PDCD2_C domain-containing protein n=1 Tax=Heligmosomoides polygyrus TaxID=6339 RepID=A0A183GL86_HELPZ|nr:unnamed protein product [Heligmosomoides polygyrus]
MENQSSCFRFHRFLNLNPTQILRYQRSGKLMIGYEPNLSHLGIPLIATDRAPVPGGAPDCERCGAPRCFELQLMPHLLSLIGVDQIGRSIDWASVYVYTCSQTCAVENHGYIKEFVCKQDFC